MALTKIQLVQILMNNRGFSKRDAQLFVDRFFDVIGEVLAKREQVKLSGLGNFSVRDKPKRPGRNPKTGKAFAISARTVVTFRAGNTLKKKVNPDD